MSINLRRWQADALDAFTHHPGRDFLLVATPGAGKTILALAAAATHLQRQPEAKIVIVAPTAKLRHQWTNAGRQLGITLESGWDGQRLYDGVDGHVITYQQLARNCATPLADHAHRLFVIIDEIHHASECRSWGTALAAAFRHAPRRLALSGTPFRSDSRPIPFITYRQGRSQADYTYGYGHALADDVVRAVYFERFGGQMDWHDHHGADQSHNFDAQLPDALINQRLRTALSPDGQWLPHILAQAANTLTDLRENYADAGGLVICIDQDHARQVADQLTDITGQAPALALSDNRDASRVISEFSRGNTPWLVAVRMVSEGVDVPRARVLVYATNITAELYFRQAVGRVVRRTDPDDGPAWVLLPDDPRLTRHAEQIDHERQHQLQDSSPLTPRTPTSDGPHPTSQYRPVGAYASGSRLTFPRHHSPPPTSNPATAVSDPEGHQLAEQIGTLTLLSLARILAELNHRAGIDNVATASPQQLTQRRKVADTWLACQ